MDTDTNTRSRTAEAITVLQPYAGVVWPEGTGGGNRALVAYLGSGQTVMVTNPEGGSLPDDTGFMIGVYREKDDTDEDPTILERTGPDAWLHDGFATTLGEALDRDNTRRGNG